MLKVSSIQRTWRLNNWANKYHFSLTVYSEIYVCALSTLHSVSILDSKSSIRQLFFLVSAETSHIWRDPMVWLRVIGKQTWSPFPIVLKVFCGHIQGRTKTISFFVISQITVPFIVCKKNCWFFPKAHTIHSKLETYYLNKELILSTLVSLFLTVNPGRPRKLPSRIAIRFLNEHIIHSCISLLKCDSSKNRWRFPIELADCIRSTVVYVI